MQIQVLNNKNAIPDRVHIALDTCVFFDAWKNPEKFQKFFALMKEKEITLTTTYLHYLEFSRGFDTIPQFDQVDERFKKIIDYVYPINDLTEEVEKAKKIYRRDGRDVDIADFFMSALMLKFKKKILVMTKNHNHFLTDLFDIQAYVPLLRTNDIQTYCFYVFSENKYIDRLKKLEKTIGSF